MCRLKQRINHRRWTGEGYANFYPFLQHAHSRRDTVHYPFMYLFYAWIWKNELTFAQTWPVALALLFGNILLAWLVLKLYDEPLRRYLSKRFK